MYLFVKEILYFKTNKMCTLALEASSEKIEAVHLKNITSLS